MLGIHRLCFLAALDNPGSLLQAIGRFFIIIISSTEAMNAA